MFQRCESTIMKLKEEIGWRHCTRTRCTTSNTKSVKRKTNPWNLVEIGVRFKNILKDIELNTRILHSDMWYKCMHTNVGASNTWDVFCVCYFICHIHIVHLSVLMMSLFQHYKAESLEGSDQLLSVVSSTSKFIVIN